VLAELAVCHPRLSFLEALEREGIDEHRRGSTELDVERARILEHHPVLDRQLLDSQSEQRGGAQLSEAPLIGKGNRRHTFGSEDPECTGLGSQS
jgi:hypothetical protein